MKVLYLILSIIIGILIYLYLHNINNFSIGGQSFNVRLYRNDERNPHRYYLVNMAGEEGGAVAADQVLLWEGILPVNEFDNINTFFNETNNEGNPIDHFNFPTREPSPDEIFKAQLISIGLSEEDAEILIGQFISILSPGHVGLGSINVRGQLPSLPADLCAAIVTMATLFVPEDFINFLRDLLLLDPGALNDIELLNINIIDDYILLLPFLTNERNDVLDGYRVFLLNKRTIYRILQNSDTSGTNLLDPSSRAILKQRELDSAMLIDIRKFIWLFLRKLLYKVNRIGILAYFPAEIDRLYRDNNGPPLDPPG